MKRSLIALFVGVALPVAGVAQSFSPMDAAVRAVTDLTAPKNLNSVSGIEREIRRKRMMGETPGILGAYLEFYKARAYPNDTFDWSEYDRAAEARRLLPPIRKPIPKGSGTQPVGVPSGNWAFAGPRNTNPAYQTYFGDRAIMGRVNALAMPPNPNRTLARSRILYAGSAGGGVWRSTDEGANWTCLTDTSAHWRYLQVGAIAVTNQTANNPTTATDIVIAGTGDARGIYRLYGFGVMRSTDGGATWEAPKPLGAGDQMPITSIAVDPDEPNRITLTTGGAGVATSNGGNQYPPPSRQDYLGSVWQSTDYGQTWNQVLATNAYWGRISIGARDRNGKRHYWVAGWNAAGNPLVQLSMDKGATWNAVTPGGLAAGNAQFAHIDVCASKNAPRVAYVMSGQNRRILITENSGGAWNNITNDFPNTYAGTANDNWSQSSYDYYIEAVPIPGGYKDLLVVGLITVAAAVRDDGTGVWSWHDIAVTGTGGALAHNDQHCIVYDRRDSSRFFVGHDGGIHRVVYDKDVAMGAGAFAWANRSANLHITQFYEGAWHPTQADVMLGGTQDNMSPRSVGAPATINNWEAAGGGDGSGSVISFSNPSIQLTLANITGAYFTNDSWATNGNANIVSSGNNSFFPPTAMDVLGNFYWCDDQVNQFTTNGTNLNAVYNSATLTAGGAGAHITALAVPLADPAVLYVGSSDGAIYVTRDATAAAPTFTRIERTAGGANLPNGSPPARYITDIAIDPFDSNRIVVSYSGIGTNAAPVTDHVYRCDNTAATDANRLWVLCDSGGNKLPNVPINTLTFDQAPNPPLQGFHVAPDPAQIDIPDNLPAGIVRTLALNQDDIDIVTNVAVRFVVSGTWNGDIYARLEHAGEHAILVNGVGRDGGPAGYSDDGFDITIDDDPLNVFVQGDVHTYRNVTGVLPPGTPLTGEWQSDGRDVPIGTVANASPRTKRLLGFTGKPVNGDWVLRISDNAGADLHRLERWELWIRGLKGDSTPVRRVYVGGDAGVFYTSDITAAPPTWTNATQPIGLPNVQVNDMEHVLGTGKLNVATFGRGMWRVDIGTAQLAGGMCHPTTIKGGGARTTTLRVVLAKPAPVGGVDVDVSTGGHANLTVPAPGKINIPAGQVTGTMVLTSNAAPVANVTVNVELKFAGERRRTQVVVTP